MAAEPMYVTLATRVTHAGHPGDTGGVFKMRVQENTTLLDSPLFPGCWVLEFLGAGPWGMVVKEHS